ncbi:hypothetical protein ACFYWU_34125 [Streptomyces chrestomyceticus]|uniref:hypothetical protein n=1 Tax=Streptomyces chrestomyceticus TaxID=68185 RepID=UPI0036B28260
MGRPRQRRAPSGRAAAHRLAAKRPPRRRPVRCGPSLVERGAAGAHGGPTPRGRPDHPGRPRCPPRAPGPAHRRPAARPPRHRPGRTADRTGAARSLLAAEQAYDRVDAAGPAPAWLGFLSEGELSGLAAIAHQALGHYRPAQAATVQALHLLPPAKCRSRAYYGVQLAEIHLAQGEREQAAHTVAALQHASLDSRRITGRLAAVQRILTLQEPRP